MKSNQKLTLLFWHRKSKADSAGFAPIICRISIDANEEELSIGKKIHLNHWDTESKMAKGGVVAKKVNQRIAQVTADLERHFTILQLEHEFITPLMLKNVFNGLPYDHKKGRAKPEEPKSTTILQVADIHIGEFTKMVDKGLRSSETLKQWKATRRKLPSS
ncbi:MAG TPA: Arm DNA-binding domain-containing protein [Chitinophagaceae bacterium]|nr:Arm DNA-binding domain-containing protein [Chitinophagaceae bacterium]